MLSTEISKTTDGKWDNTSVKRDFSVPEKSLLEM